MKTGTYNEVFYVNNKDIIITDVQYCNSVTNDCFMDLLIDSTIKKEIRIIVYPILHKNKENIFFNVHISLLANYPTLSYEVLQEISLLAERFRISCIYKIYRILSVGHLPYSLISSEEDLIKSYIKKVIHT